MTKSKDTKIVEALESIAYDEDERDVLHSLNALRELVAFETTDVHQPAVGEYNFFDVKAPALALLNYARGARSKRDILRVAAAHMGQYGRDEPDLDSLFAARVVWNRKARRVELRLLGPVDASPRFLIAYAFYLVAQKRRVSEWSRSRKRCPYCNEWFVDKGTTGRSRTFCSPKHQIMFKRIKV